MPPATTKPICLLSGPRNVSTALMYSFAQRIDIRVVDEPLYGHYLRVSGADHPGGHEVLAAMNCDGNAVMRKLLDEQSHADSKRLFIKHMAHHLIDLDLGFLYQTRNVFLIRDPLEMLPSLVNQLPNAQLADTGLQQQWQLFSDLAGSGVTPAVLDSRELLLDPDGVLKKLCKFLGLEFSSRMLHWNAGPRIEDGVWAPHWYDSVHQSVGFEAYKPKTTFPQHLRLLLEECQPWYDKLFERAIRANATGDSR
jgi:hypothetical protein